MVQVYNMPPEELAQHLEARDVLLIDVREENEFADARIDGAILAPLSTFDPAALPDPHGKRVVLQCAGGVRSVRALEACQAAGLDITDHLAGGIKAWHAAGLPIVR
ncbi:hypothetical protein ABAC460_03690 [Asticcacaulis sp. AC460]|uniref:rhodanese-like domain-containing protein n=1 Tax=Asticcacaulis sp. AC460 TaxID=1282360 RepID=UPI0003C3E433|nr:rhodanese-like domain-containing protein [Asticcacaulis sp. AC460]ESQ92012.1 hypothetical protein ABAC460_03690 [Asticcacaulis sp. AC460]